MIDDLDKLARGPYAAGIVGSLVSLAFVPGATWGERVFNVAAGSAAAIYVAPGLAEWAHVQSVGMQSLLSFMVGLFGLNLAHAAVRAIRETPFGQVIAGWLTRRS